MTVFSIDTSALIAARYEVYRPTTFPALWTALEQLIANGELVASEEVLYELQRQDDELLAWARNQPRLFIPLDETIEGAVRRIVNVPHAINGKAMDNSADPFVIAVAMAKNGTVVSSEKPGSPSNPKIPYLCQHFNIPHQSLQEFVNGLGRSFG